MEFFLIKNTEASWMFKSYDSLLHFRVCMSLGCIGGPKYSCANRMLVGTLIHREV